MHLIGGAFAGCLQHGIREEASTDTLTSDAGTTYFAAPQATRCLDVNKAEATGEKPLHAAGQEVDSPRPTKQPRRAGQQAVTLYVRRAPAPAAAAAVRKKAAEPATAVGPLQGKVSP